MKNYIDNDDIDQEDIQDFATFERPGLFLSIVCAILLSMAMLIFFNS